MNEDPRDVEGFRRVQKVIAEAVDDDDYRRRLLSDPKEVLREAGLTVSDEVQVTVHENTADRLHLVLPSAPTWDEIDPDETDLTLICEWPF